MSGGEAFDWGVLAARLVHTTKLWIIEAMLAIDRPLSAVELERVFGGQFSISSLWYHLTTLAKVGVLVPHDKERVRGALKTRYAFAPAVKS